MKEKIKCVSEMKDMLIDAFKAEIGNGIHNLDTNEAYKVADIIKDLAETERNCYEAYYYKSVIGAMEDVEEDEDDEKQGYRRTPPYRMGYRPMMDQKPYIDAYLRDPDEFRQNMKEDDDRRYGKAYNAYKESRKHYTQTKRAEDKEEMNAHANEHLADTIATIREIWQSADTEQKKRMKNDLTNLVNEMGT